MPRSIFVFVNPFQKPTRLQDKSLKAINRFVWIKRMRFKSWNDLKCKTTYVLKKLWQIMALRGELDRLECDESIASAMDEERDRRDSRRSKPVSSSLFKDVQNNHRVAFMIELLRNQ
jgi:hypothetical protein